MSEYMENITPEMTHIVDKLRMSNFENATAEEIEVYAEWTKLHALHHEEFAQKAEERKAESDERRELFKQQAQSALNALDSLAELAKAKLKAVENGQ